jgi:hypothetical protein
VKLPRDIFGGGNSKSVRAAGLHNYETDRLTRSPGPRKPRVTVPMQRNLAVGTLQSILRQAGVDLEEFQKAL